MKLIVMMLWRLRQKLIAMISLSYIMMKGKVSVRLVYLVFVSHEFIYY